MNRQMVRIIPREMSNIGAIPTQGTRIMVGDQELSHVTKIVLTAEINDVWTAQITCHALIPSLDVVATIIYQPKRWWEKLIDWVIGEDTWERPKGD